MLQTILFTLAFATLVQAAPESVEIEKAKAVAALRLKEAMKDREIAKGEACCIGLAEGRKKSQETGKPLILWVGMECKEIPQIHDSLKEFVHAHVKEYNGTKDAGIVVPTANGDYHFAKEKLLNGTFKAKDILETLGRSLIESTNKKIMAAPVVELRGFPIENCPTRV